MTSKRTAAKKPYTPPSFEKLDADAARVELEATGIPKDPGVKKMFSAIDTKLKDRTKAQAGKVGAQPPRS